MRIFQWLAIVGMTIFFPVSALAINLGADELGTAGAYAGIDTSSANASLGGIVGSVISAVLNLMGAIIFLLFIYAGFLWMTAQGDEKQVTKAKTIMGNAVAGLILIFLALGITTFLAGIAPGAGGLGDTTETFQNAVTGAGFTAADADLLGVIGSIVGVVLNLLGVVLLGIFVYAGFLWMTAAGDGKQVEKAKTMMRNAFIGLIITLLSRSLANFVIDQLTTAGVAFVPSAAIHSTMHT